MQLNIGAMAVTNLGRHRDPISRKISLTLRGNKALENVHLFRWNQREIKLKIQGLEYI